MSKEIAYTIQPADNIGTDALRANGLVNGEAPVISTIFTGKSPGQEYPYPKGDVYLTQLGARIAETGSLVKTLKMLPGRDDMPSEKEYLRTIGLLPEGAWVGELTAKVKDDRALGWPFTDPMGLLEGEATIHNSGHTPIYISTFTSDEIRKSADTLGMQALERPHSDITNNKAELRRKAEKYGINMFEGLVLDTVADYNTLLTQYQGKTMWMKYPTGSGGDLVRRIEAVSEETVIGAISRIREEIVEAHTYGTGANDGNRYWPVNKLHPDGFPLVIEVDAAEEGKIIMNGSNSFTTKNDGSVVIHGFFEQLTSEQGEYLGSKPMEEDEQIQQAIIEQTLNLAQYNMEENGYFGNQGADYFVIERPDGSKVVKVVELNTRPPISMYAHIVANRLGYQHFINVNVELEEGKTIKDMGDFFDAVGKDLAYGQDTEEGKVQVVPLAFRTMFSRTQERGEEVFDSPQFKVVLLGQSPKHCLELVQRLKERGVLPKAA